MGRPRHQRSEYQVPAEYDGTKRLYLDPSCEIESHEGFATAHASLRRSSSLHPTWPSDRSWLTIARWSKQPFRSAHRTTAPDTTIQPPEDSSPKIRWSLAAAARISTPMLS